MKDYAWVETGPWKWKHELGDMAINAVTQIRDIPQLAHKLRTSSRTFQWEQIPNLNRHETADFIDTPLKRIFVKMIFTGPGVGSSVRLKLELLRWGRWFPLLGMTAVLAILLASTAMLI